MQMTYSPDNSDWRSAELRFALERAKVLAGSSDIDRSTDRWAREAAIVGDLSALATLTLRND